jgi:hypothetical protein
MQFSWRLELKYCIKQNNWVCLSSFLLSAATVGKTLFNEVWNYSDVALPPGIGAGIAAEIIIESMEKKHGQGKKAMMRFERH